MGLCCPGGRAPDKANKIQQMHDEVLTLLKAIRFLYLSERRYGMVVKLIHIYNITQKYYQKLEDALAKESTEVEPSSESLRALDQDFSDTQRAIVNLRSIFNTQVSSKSFGFFPKPKSVTEHIKQDLALMGVHSTIKHRIHVCYFEKRGVVQLAKDFNSGKEFSDQDEADLKLICKHTTHIATSKSRRVTYPLCEHDEALEMTLNDVHRSRRAKTVVVNRPNSIR